MLIFSSGGPSRDIKQGGVRAVAVRGGPGAHDPQLHPHALLLAEQALHLPRDRQGGSLPRRVPGHPRGHHRGGLQREPAVRDIRPPAAVRQRVPAQHGGTVPGHGGWRSHSRRRLQ